MNKEKLNEIVFQSLGHVSMLWSETPKGVFDSTKAEMIGNEILNAVEEYIKTLQNG